MATRPGAKVASVAVAAAATMGWRRLGTKTPGPRPIRSTYRIQRADAHEHTFVNPHGIVHHIGCFAAAPGCVHVGVTESAFSWFPGWTWQVAVCARCRAHVGWIFRCAGQQFHGLILAALRP